MAEDFKPRWMRESNSGGSTPRTVRKQEEDAASLIASRGNARRRRGSGSHPLGKGDAVGSRDLGECKQTFVETDGKTWSIKLAWLFKIEREAEMEGKMPFLHVRFIGPGPRVNSYPGGDGRGTRSWVMVPDHFFKRLMEVNIHDDA